MKLYLLRHGATAGNLARRYIGRTDEPLCPEGESRIRAAGCFPHVQTVYVSPLCRAIQTSELLFPNARQIWVDGFREMDFGLFEGRTADEMADDPLYRAWVDGLCLDVCPGGEGREAFDARTIAGYKDILKSADKDAPLIIVAHGGTIMSLMSAYARPSRDYWQWQAPLGGGYMGIVSADGCIAAYQKIDQLGGIHIG